jgi:hypothetical protein
VKRRNAALKGCMKIQSSRPLFAGCVIGLWLVFATSLLPGADARAQSYNEVPIPGGRIAGPPVPQNPVTSEEDGGEVALAAGRDLTGRRYYNKPGASLSEYYADWQVCRLIARGSVVDIAGMTYVSTAPPLVAGAGGALGSAVGSAMKVAEVRDANREACMLIKGWRIVRPSVGVGANITTLAGAKREAYLARLIGEPEPKGKIVGEWNDNTLQPDPALHLDAPVAGRATLSLGEGRDAALPIELKDNEAAIVLAFVRPDDGSAGRSASLRLLRYDPAAGDVYGPASSGAVAVEIVGEDRHAAYEIHVAIVKGGHYVIDNVTVANENPGETFCFGAPVVEVPVGKISYLGDWIPLKDIKLSTGERLDYALAFTDRLERTRQALAQFQPQAAEALQQATMANGATYSCSGVKMTKWSVAAFPNLGAAASHSER